MSIVVVLPVQLPYTTFVIVCIGPQMMRIARKASSPATAHFVVERQVVERADHIIPRPVMGSLPRKRWISG